MPAQNEAESNVCTGNEAREMNETPTPSLRVEVVGGESFDSLSSLSSLESHTLLPSLSTHLKKEKEKKSAAETGGRRGKPAHRAAVLALVQDLEAEGRVILCDERLPRVLATKAGQVWAVAPVHLRPDRRPGKGRWHWSKTHASVRRQWTHLDGVHTYLVGPVPAHEAFRTEFARLKAEGWRIIRLARKCPDALLVRPTGKIVAVDAMTTRDEYSLRRKRESYSMFDEVVLRTIGGAP